MRLLMSVFSPGRLYTLFWALSLLASIILCFIPLFNVVGYESAAFFGVFGGFATVILSLNRIRLDGAPPPLSTHSVQGPASRFATLAGLHLLMFVGLPMVVLGLNAFRVTNCAPLVGLAFWGLIPVVSVGVGQAVAFLAHAIAGERRWLRNVCAVLLILVSIVMLALQLALEPPIVGFQVFLGFFSGSIYDEALALPSSLVIYRLTIALGVAGVIASLETGWRLRSFRSFGAALSIAVVGLVGALGLWANRTTFGIDIDRETIADTLGARVETEHFVIVYPANSKFERQARAMAEDHEFRYAEMKAFFGTDPVAARGQKVHSFVYADRESKGALMGGRRTQVAKLWLHEIHILWRHHGDHMLAHELSHVFTEPFGSGPLRLSSSWGVGINMGLVEGVATAADWHAGNMTPHEAAASLRRLKRAPDNRNLLGASGFWTQSSSRAYTLMGSFIKYVVDEYGIERFKVAYGNGDFRAAYGKSVDELVNEWEEFIDAVPLSEQTRIRAEYLYDRPSIFQKTCARTIAELRRKAGLANARGQVERGREIWLEILGFDPGNTRYRLSFARFLLRAEKLDEAEEQTQLVLDTPGLSKGEQAAARELSGDIAWYREQFEQAATAYSECLELGPPLSRERFVHVKRAVVADPIEWQRDLGFDYLVDDTDSPVQLFFPSDWVRRNPHHPIANYLLGRRLVQAWESDRALPFLEAATGQLGIDVLEAENTVMYVQALYFSGRLDDARQHAEALAQHARSTYREMGKEWVDRIAWRTGNSIDNDSRFGGGP